MVSWRRRENHIIVKKKRIKVVDEVHGRVITPKRKEERKNGSQREGEI